MPQTYQRQVAHGLFSVLALRSLFIPGGFHFPSLLLRSASPDLGQALQGLNV